MMNAGRPNSPIQLATCRHSLYGFLSTVLLESPSVNLTDLMCDEDLLSFMETLFGDDKTAPSREFLLERGNTETSEETVRRDYEVLFNVPGPKYVAPYESVFLDERPVGEKRVRGLLFGPSTDDVIRFYHVAGLEVSAAFEELPDHIGLELHFMAYLCDRERQAFAESDERLGNRIRETQWGFLDRHLARWVADFSTSLEEKASTPFYRGIARLLREFVLRDHKCLTEARATLDA